MPLELVYQRGAILFLGAAVADRLAKMLQLGEERRLRRRMLGCGRVETRVHLAQQGELFLNDRVWHDEGKVE
jgi:hypothetical protein